MPVETPPLSPAPWVTSFGSFPGSCSPFPYASAGLYCQPGFEPQTLICQMGQQLALSAAAGILCDNGLDCRAETRSYTRAEAKEPDLIVGESRCPSSPNAGRFLSLSTSLQEEFQHSEGHDENDSGHLRVQQCSLKCNYGTGGYPVPDFWGSSHLRYLAGPKRPATEMPTTPARGLPACISGRLKYIPQLRGRSPASGEP